MGRSWEVYLACEPKLANGHLPCTTAVDAPSAMSLRGSRSPTARLLRKSRLFSLPPPLPAPEVGSEHLAAGMTRGSDTATLPYPIRQAIATKPSSLGRGDWGVKRPLPLKSTTASSNPTLRIMAVDTIEHITDFESAADHVRTGEKWQEMRVPMLQEGRRIRGVSDLPQSAFERRFDATDPESAMDRNAQQFRKLKDDTRNRLEQERKKSTLALRIQEVLRLGHKLQARFQASLQCTEKAVRRFPARRSIAPVQPDTFDGVADEIAQAAGVASLAQTGPPMQHRHQEAHLPEAGRWKVAGPWLPTIPAFDFARYLETDVAQRRAEFYQHLVTYAYRKIIQTRNAQSRNPATFDELDTHAEDQPISDLEIATTIQELREGCLADPLRSELVQRLVVPFLDLLPWTARDVKYQHGIKNDLKVQRPYGLWTTHPSAGLSYARTAPCIMNHPLLGPQREITPVPARVFNLRSPRSVGVEAMAAETIGVGGIVCAGVLSSPNVARTDRPQTLDVEQSGGPKRFVRPLGASVQSNGRVEVEVNAAGEAAQDVAAGLLDTQLPKYLASPTHDGSSGELRPDDFKVATAPSPQSQSPPFLHE